jgi:hypothetical protein
MKIHDIITYFNIIHVFYGKYTRRDYRDSRVTENKAIRHLVNSLNEIIIGMGVIM